jgi:hypothetical protein
MADVFRPMSEKVGFGISSFHLTRSVIMQLIPSHRTYPQTHILYTRFHSVSAPLSPLLGELEQRANAHPDELSFLLAECHGAYFEAREG